MWSAAAMPPRSTSTEQPLPLNQLTRCWIGMSPRDVDARRGICLVQQNAHLSALEERHRVSGMVGRYVIESVSRILQSSRGEIQDAQLELMVAVRLLERINGNRGLSR